MFNCHKCQAPTGPRVKPKLRVIESRHREYLNSKGEVGSKGWEIIKEVNLCPPCDRGQEANGTIN